MTWLVHPNGPRAGKRWRFTDSQVRFLLHWYALRPDGRWLYHHGVRRWAKGAGKSPFAAAHALVEFCAPVRLKDFDAHAPGGCVGKPVDLPWIQIAAAAESQTTNTMRMVRALAPKGSRVVGEHHLDPGKTIYYRPDGGMLQVITNAAETNEGAETSFGVGDETEHWTPGNGGVELSQVLDRNMGKSGSRWVETANAWKPGAESVAEASWNAFVLQEEGRTRGESRMLYDARLAPPGTDMTDRTSLIAALEHVYDDAFWVDLPGIVEKIWDPRTPVDVSRRFYLNWPAVDTDAWQDPKNWSAMAAPQVQVESGEDIVMFFDGSKSRDATALIGCRIEDGHVFTLGVWEPTPERPVPVREVDAAVRKALDTYHVEAFFADVREWESFAKVSWPDLFDGAGLSVWAESKQSKEPQPVAWDMRGHVAEFTKAAELCHAEIEDGLFTHDGDQRVARHIANARRRPNRYGVSIGKDSPDSPHKIDAAVCVIGVRMLRQRVLRSPRRKRPVTAGLTTFS